MNRRALALSLAAAVALLLASCGGDEQASSTTSTTAGAGRDTGVASEDDVYVGTIGGVDVEGGVLVRSLEKGSPVASSGLLTGDVIVAVDDTPIDTIDGLAGALSGFAETYDGGDQFELTVARGKGEKTLRVTLAANVYLGAGFANAPQGGGALVKSVPRGGPAADAGIEPGDVIVTVDGQAVREFDDLLQALATHVAGDEVEIEVKRGSQDRTLTATLEKRGYGRLKVRPGG